MGFGRGGPQGGGYQGGGGRGRGRGRGGNQGVGRGGQQGGGYQTGGHQGGGYQGSNHHNGGGNLAGLAIKNWSNSKGTKEQLLAWLSRSAGGQPVVSHELVGARQNVLIIGVNSHDKDNFLRLNNRNWAGTTLVVETSNRPPPQNNQGVPHNQQNNSGFSGRNNQNDTFTNTVQDQIVAVLERRYEVNGKHLNLTGLINDKDILSIPDVSTVEQDKVWESIFTVCKTKIWPKNHDRNVNVQAITLRGNALDSVSHIKSLGWIFPRLHNLDLGDNQLSSIDALVPFKTEFRDLEHLIISDNPVMSQPDVLPILRQWYPKLQQINNLPADSSQALIAGTASAAPGVAVGQAPFVPAPPDQCVPPVVISVAPNRPPHPEIPLDSFFAVQTPDKPADIFQKEVMGLQFSLESGLTLARTEEILRVNDWNYQLALAQFYEFRAQNRIPQTEFFKRS